MTIETKRPELAALIQERMTSSGLENVEDALMQALKSSSLPGAKVAERSEEKSPAMGAELVAAMQASPFKEIHLEPGREPMPVRDVVF
jgi:hypothetical protein